MTMFDRRFFILAPSFHGATLLSKLLNSHPEVVALGDTYPSNAFDQLCGCGKRVSQCRFWITVKQAIGSDRYRRWPAMLPYHPQILSPRIDRWLVNSLFEFPLRPSASRENLKQFVDDYETFLRAVNGGIGRRRGHIFVDGVKSIPRVNALLAAGASVDGVIHLVRNARDYAKSFEKQAGGGLARLAEAGVRWRRYHARARRLGRQASYLRVTYEDLADRVDDVLEKLFAFLGAAPMTISELRPNFSDTWHFMGNSSLMAFDGSLHRSQHGLTRLEKSVVRLAAGVEPGTRIRRRESATC